MDSPQGGIFALGTASHAYLEFDASSGRGPELITTIACLREPRTTMGGVNLVAGFRPELWREVSPGDSPKALEGFNADIAGPDGFVMPARSTTPSSGSRAAPTTWFSRSRAGRSRS
jgi:putative iron-dependent peroxidase